MTSNAPIGVFDSGVGGLSILDKIHTLLPHENLLYVADSAHAPYGSRSSLYIRERCEQIMGFFLARQVKAVVLACNTATAAAVADLRAHHGVPIIGMEPAIKPAAEQSRSGVVGVLATAGTIDSDKFISLKSRFTDQVEIITRACPGLVEHIERLQTDQLGLTALLQDYIWPMLEKGMDTLVLGCTHYSLIIPQIRGVAGKVLIMDTGAAVAKELQRRMAAEGLLDSRQQAASVSFFTSGDPQHQSLLLGHYWGRELAVESLAAQEQLI
ncbi:MAG: glutamate racemase [Pseudohongiellaceae bacterium]